MRITSENRKLTPTSGVIKYLGLHLDKKLTWKDHVDKKKEEIKLRTRKMHWLLGRKIYLSTSNKLLLYKTIVKPMRTYGLWGCTKESNTAVIQRLQNKCLRNITKTENVELVIEVQNYSKRHS